jgi:hypothetical protein
LKNKEKQGAKESELHFCKYEEKIAASADFKILNTLWRILIEFAGVGNKKC